VTALAALGARLRYAGLSPRALAAWVGSDRISALPALLGKVAGAPVTRGSALLALFVAGDSVPIEIAPHLDELHRHDLVAIADGRARARVAILPLGPSLLVCDRLDTSDGLDVVCFPDDSSYHLALALPLASRRPWLDLGCGSAFAALLRPELARSIVGADLNARAAHYARLGCALSGHAHIAVVEADLGDGVPAELRGSCEIVSCNAPIPQPVGSPYRGHWRLTDSSFVERLFAGARAFVAPDGLVVVHAAIDALAPVIEELPGHRVVVEYTPEGVRGFAVAWWRPDGEERLVRARRLLTEWRPHITHEDRIAAMARTLDAR
jgi:hypothetical protein